MTKTWTFIGLFKLLVVLVLAVVYRPNLNTGYAVDTYAYLGAVAYLAIYSLLPYVLMALRHQQSLALSSPRIVYSLLVLLLGWLAMVAFFLGFVLTDEADHRSFWVYALICTFVVFFLFLVIGKITGIAAESEQTQQLNLARRENFSSQIDDFFHQIPSALQQNPQFSKALHRLRDEVRLIPSQTSDIDFSRFNAVMAELKRLAQTQPAAEPTDDTLQSDQMIRLMDRASALLSSIKSR